MDGWMDGWMDVRMPGTVGIDACKKDRRTDRQTVLIFGTVSVVKLSFFGGGNQVPVVYA